MDASEELVGYVSQREYFRSAMHRRARMSLWKFHSASDKACLTFSLFFSTLIQKTPFTTTTTTLMPAALSPSPLVAQHSGSSSSGRGKCNNIPWWSMTCKLISLIGRRGGCMLPRQEGSIQTHASHSRSTSQL